MAVVLRKIAVERPIAVRFRKLTVATLVILVKLNVKPLVELTVKSNVVNQLFVIKN